ncbi:uncharacterized protein IAS62_002835 [Cryptococcus decagattii]|uniref:Uncharacterized protein n=1 Tax=Cryptococcus decagattii TaxID=1859122 RepID=A0ABZ2AWG3_9TREE
MLSRYQPPALENQTPPVHATRACFYASRRAVPCPATTSPATGTATFFLPIFLPSCQLDHYSCHYTIHHVQPTDELAPTRTEGYKSKTVAELAALDQEDESLQRWKQSLGIGAGASGGGEKRVVLKSLFLSSPTLPNPITIDLTQPKDALAKLKKDPGRRVLCRHHLCH